MAGQPRAPLRPAEHCRRIAEGLFNLAYRQETELFDFGTRGADHPPVVLVVDRLDDPVRTATLH